MPDAARVGGVPAILQSQLQRERLFPDERLASRVGLGKLEYGGAMDEAMASLEHKLDDGLTVQLWEDRDRTKVIICPYLSCYTLGYLRFRNSRIKTVSLAEEHEDKESYLKAYAMWKGGHA